MTDDELVRAAMVLPGWRWMPGMLSDCGQRVAWVMDGGYVGGISDGDTRIRPRNAAICRDDIPDQDDDANGGIALGLLGDEAWRVRMRRDGAAWEWAQDAAVRGSGTPGFSHQHLVWTVAPSLFLACCAAAVSRGRWPGGESVTDTNAKT